MEAEAKNARSNPEDGEVVRDDDGTTRRFPKIPLIFLGLGLYRAWIEIAYVGSFLDFPIQSVAARDVFDVTAVVAWFVVAIFARRLVSLSNRRWVFAVAGALLAFSTAANFASLAYPELMAPFAFVVSAAAGIGIALLILLWSEFYGCVNPMRVALYYSASILLGAAVVYLYKGFVPEYLAGMTIVLPLLSAWMAYKSFRELPAESLPKPPTSRFLFPWKPVLLMAVYSFAYGLKESSLYMFTGPHSSAGVIIAAVVVLVGVVSQGKKFDFGVMYRFGLPFMVGAFLLVPALGFPSEQVAGFCATLSYTAFSILIMIVLSNMVYRYGMNALWLFAVERAVRQLFMFGGREAESLVEQMTPVFPQGEVLINVVIVLLVIATTMILLSEKDLMSRWGIGTQKPLHSNSPDSNSATDRPALGSVCADMAKHYALSMRESEVLLLLAQKKSIADIEKELFIANGTAKAHVRHIYQKLDIHSREELFDLVEKTEEGSA